MFILFCFIFSVLASYNLTIVVDNLANLHSAEKVVVGINLFAFIFCTFIFLYLTINHPL